MSIGFAAGPETALRYLGRYTHRVAISNQRLVGLEGNDALFRYKDRADDDRWKVLRLPVHEFIRRFLLHVMPDHFVRIRYFGLLARRHRRRLLDRCREHLGVPPSPILEPIVEGWSERLLRLTRFAALQCPYCKAGRLHPVSSLASIAGSTPRGQP